MINFVIVSHSFKIAQGVVDLLNEIKSPECIVLAAGGLSDGSIGTDAMSIMKAIESIVDRSSAIVVLVDLGSAILSTETAIDLLDEARARKVYLSTAALVEGSLAAVMAASCGAEIDKVLYDAHNAASLKAQG